MLKINMLVKSVDYGSVLYAAFPKVLEELKLRYPDQPIVRLFLALGEDGPRIMQKLLDHLPKETLDELMLQSMNCYSKTLTQKLNEELRSHPQGQYMTIGDCSVVQLDEKMVFQAKNVKVDYRALLCSMEVGIVRQLVGQVTGNGLIGWFAGRLAGNAPSLCDMLTEAQLERAGLLLLEQDAVKDKLLIELTSALQQKGLIMELDDLSITAAEQTQMLGDPTVVETLQLTPAVENALINALAAFLKGN